MTRHCISSIVNLNMGFGEKIKTVRKGRGETLHKVAMGTDIDSTLLSKIERGIRLPTNEQILPLAEHFGLDQKQLAIEATAEKILTQYGYSDVTYEAVRYVQEKMQKYSAGDLEGGSNE